MSSAISKASSAVASIVNAIKSGLSSAASSLASAGRSMIDGMWSGISGAIDSLKSKISSGISGITDKVRSVLGIHSPSTVFADIGWNMGEGMGVGFQNVMKQVRRDMENAIPMDFEVNAGWNARGGMQPGVSVPPAQTTSGTVINQSIVVTTPKALSEKELSRELHKLGRQLVMESF